MYVTIVMKQAKISFHEYREEEARKWCTITRNGGVHNQQGLGRRGQESSEPITSGRRDGA